MPENNCIATLVEIKGTLADIVQIKARVFDGEHLTGHIGLPSTVSSEIYEGPYEVTPSAHNDIILATNNKTMDDDVTVFKIPY